MDKEGISGVIKARKLAESAPESNPEFSELSIDEKFRLLGLRIIEITDQDRKHMFKREFSGSDVAEDGTPFNLKIEAYFDVDFSARRSSEDGLPQVNDAYHIIVVAESKGTPLIEEGVAKPEYDLSATEDEISTMLDRVEASVSLAEQLHAKAA